MTHGPITKDATTWALGLIQIRVGPSAANIASIAPVLGASNSIGALSDTKFNCSAEFFKQMSGFPLREDGSIPLSEASALAGNYKEITPFNVALARGLDPTGSIAAAAIEDVAINSTSGTRSSSMSIAVLDGTPADWAVIDEEWTVVFTGATAGAIFGKVTGHVHDFSALSSAMAPTDGNSKKYFSIPANFFTGTWAADDTYVFYTIAGGDSTYSNTHSGSIGLGGLVAPVDIRVEGVYTYPNGTNTMTFIYPRAQVEANMELGFNQDSEATPPISFNSKNASSDNTAGNAVWDSMPLGRIVWA